MALAVIKHDRFESNRFLNCIKKHDVVENPAQYERERSLPLMREEVYYVQRLSRQLPPALIIIRIGRKDKIICSCNVEC